MTIAKKPMPVTKECRCASKINDMLGARGSELVLTFIMKRKNIFARARVETQKLLGKTRRKQVFVVATFCPFCGVKYPEVA